MSAAPLRKDRLEVPDWLSSGEGTLISFGVFIALRLLFRFLESDPLLLSGGKGPWDSPGWIEYGRASAMDLTGRGYFQSGDL